MILILSILSVIKMLELPGYILYVTEKYPLPHLEIV